MSINTPPAPMLPSDFATGERTEPLTPGEVLEESPQGDFAAGERTDSATQEEIRKESLHGDFAAGERTEPLPIDGETPGTFGDTGA